MTVLVLSAFFSETALLIKKFGAKEIPTGSRTRLFQTVKGGMTIRFGITGEGKKNVQRFFEMFSVKVGTHDLPGLVISTGYAGALEKDLKSGDIVIAESVTDLSTGKNYRLETPFAPEGKYSAKICAGLTVDRLADGVTKTGLAVQSPGAAFVDMESSAVLDHYGPKRIPIMIIRSISDPLGFRFPAKGFVRDNWKDIPIRLWIKRLIMDPADFTRAVGLQRNLSKARKKISRAVSAVLDHMIPARTSARDE